MTDAAFRFSETFPSGFSIETPRVLLEPAERVVPVSIHFSIFDKHMRARCGTAAYVDISFEDRRLALEWEWAEAEEADQGLIKNLKFGLLSYAFDVMKMEKVEMRQEGSFFIARAEWPGTKEVFFPELI